MKKMMSLALVALLAATPAMAEGNGVVGFDYGHSKVSDTDLKGGGVGIYGGYRFGDTYAVEVGYRRLFSDTVVEMGIPVKVTGTALQASALAFVPMGSDFSVFGRLGVNRLKAKASAGGFAGSETETKGFFGIGAEYAFNPSTALRVEVQKPDSDVRTVSVGLKFSF